MFWKRTFGDKCLMYFTNLVPFLSLNKQSTARALKRTASANLNHEHEWPTGPILSTTLPGMGHCFYCIISLMPVPYTLFWVLIVALLQTTSVLWHCWLGGRKVIWPVKKLSGGMLAWLSVWFAVQIWIWPRWCHCHSLSLASVKFKLVLLPAHPGDPRQSPEGRKMGVCVSVRACMHACMSQTTEFCYFGLAFQVASLCLLQTGLRSLCWLLNSGPH